MVGARNGGTHAVVVGAGIAGLAAARAVRDAVDRVTMLDADALPERAEDRRGTPQSHHIHALLQGGAEALETLFPAFGTELDAAGGRALTHGSGFGFRAADGWIREVPGLAVRDASRPSIERVLRDAVRADGRIALVDGWRVEGLEVDSRGRVTGVRGRDRSGRSDRLRSELVIDASGRGSRAPTWLEALGHAPPVDVSVDARLWYASTVGRGELPTPGGMEAFVVVPTAEHPAGAGVTAGEGGYTISLSGLAPDEPPSTLAEMLAHARRAATPLVARVLEALDLDPAIHVTRATSNRLRPYHEVALPQGFVLLGDSVCCFDPIYGQGMSVAAVQAVALRDLLGEAGPLATDLPARFQARAWDIARIAWRQAVGADLQLPTIDARPPFAQRPLASYVRRLRRLATVDGEVARRLGMVMHLVAPPESLLDPWLVRRVLRDLVMPVAAPAHPADESLDTGAAEVTLVDPQATA